MLHLGDNYEVLKTLDDNSVDLIYLDPPFYSQRDYGDFDDKWKSLEQYLTFIKLRVQECYRILKDTGSLYLHCDTSANAYIRVNVLDDVLGDKLYRNTITWLRHAGKNSITRNYSRDSDIILFYAGNDYTFNLQHTPLTDKRIKEAYCYEDERGRYARSDIGGHGGRREGLHYEFRGYKPPKHGWKITEEHMEDLYANGLLYLPPNKSNAIKKKIYLHTNAGKILGNVWTDIPNRGTKQIRYQTEKPVPLLERIIMTSSNEGDIVLDPFLGSGTTAVACKRLNRKFIGVDINPKSIEITERRLQEFML